MNEKRLTLIELQNRINQKVLGQEAAVEQLVLALIANGHVLLQGLPGLAKTRSVNALASEIKASLNRIQFTPDMLPADITGSEVFEATSQTLSFSKGPVFTDMLLADEINRAPAKVQSALLEAMAEKQVTVSGQTYSLPEIFMVLATQNPAEQEGTYPLPEAQMDRFLIQILIDYPSPSAEIQMLKMLSDESSDTSKPVSSLSKELIMEVRREVNQLHVSDNVYQYIVDLISATRTPERFSNELADWIELGSSPRGTIALDKCARAHAWLNGQNHVTPENVRAIAHAALRHRITPKFSAVRQGIDTNTIITKAIESVGFV